MAETDLGYVVTQNLHSDTIPSPGGIGTFGPGFRLPSDVTSTTRPYGGNVDTH